MSKASELSILHTLGIPSDDDGVAETTICTRRKSLHVGLMVGKISHARSAVDEKGRIILPKAIRTDLGLTEGSEVVVRLEKQRVIVSKAVNPEDFIRDMEGFVKDDSPLPLVDPLSLKRIWEKA